MNKRIKHSLSDWNFPSGSLELTALHVISSPTAIRAHTDRTAGYTWVFLKPSLAPCLTQGRIVSWMWHRSGSSAFPKWAFRAQDLPPGQGATDNNPANCYQVNIDWSGIATRIFIGYWLDGVWTQLWSGESADWASVYLTWSKWRVTWYEYVTDTLESYLRIVVEYFEDGAWHEATHFDDNNNRWSGSPANRVGFCLFGLNVADDWYDILDDTEIWEKSE